VKPMDRRLAALGILTASVSAIFAALGLLTGYATITGAALSFLILGAALTFMGATFREPLLDLYTSAVASYSRVVVRALEDLGLASNPAVYGCVKSGSEVLVTFSGRGLSCSEVDVGIGMSGAGPYVAVPVAIPADYAGPRLSEYIEVLGLAKRCELAVEGSTAVVELRGVNRGVAAGPANPVRLITVAVAALALGSDVRVSEESLEGDVYRLRVERV